MDLKGIHCSQYLVEYSSSCYEFNGIAIACVTERPIVAQRPFIGCYEGIQVLKTKIYLSTKGEAYIITTPLFH